MGFAYKFNGSDEIVETHRIYENAGAVTFLLLHFPLPEEPNSFGST